MYNYHLKFCSTVCSGSLSTSLPHNCVTAMFTQEIYFTHNPPAPARNTNSHKPNAMPINYVGLTPQSQIIFSTDYKPHNMIPD